MDTLNALDAILKHFDGTITSFIVICLFFVVLIYLKKINSPRSNAKPVSTVPSKTPCKTEIKYDILDLKVALTEIQEKIKKDLLDEKHNGDREILEKISALTKRIESFEDTNHKEHSDVVDLLHEVSRLIRGHIFEQTQVLKEMASQLDRLTDALD